MVGGTFLLPIMETPSCKYSPGLPRWCSGKESACQCSRRRFDPWVRKIPWSRKWQPTPIFLPGKSHGQRSLAGYSPWSRRGSELTHTDSLSASSLTCTFSDPFRSSRWSSSFVCFDRCRFTEGTSSYVEGQGVSSRPTCISPPCLLPHRS